MKQIILMVALLALICGVVSAQDESQFGPVALQANEVGALEILYHWAEEGYVLVKAEASGDMFSYTPIRLGDINPMGWNATLVNGTFAYGLAEQDNYILRFSNYGGDISDWDWNWEAEHQLVFSPEGPYIAWIDQGTLKVNAMAGAMQYTSLETDFVGIYWWKTNGELIAIRADGTDYTYVVIDPFYRDSTDENIRGRILQQSNVLADLAALVNPFDSSELDYWEYSDDQAFVAGIGDGTISILNTQTGEVKELLDTVVGNGPLQLANQIEFLGDEFYFISNGTVFSQSLSNFEAEPEPIATVPQ
jgi:hypothetical protein